MKRIKEYWSFRWKYDNDSKWVYSGSIMAKEDARRLADKQIGFGHLAQIIRVTATYHIDEIEQDGGAE
ncbi:hypothetical protein SDC9_88334 [bioreactor metagenome]|uniref:Uncharacterized protein n=1 Tax=bioreactor metagenome TaxID=1076179 RepID=A0A644ZMT5_9ZZZZ